jgi:hypothetical protein
MNQLLRNRPAKFPTRQAAPASCDQHGARALFRKTRQKPVQFVFVGKPIQPQFDGPRNSQSLQELLPHASGVPGSHHRADFVVGNHRSIIGSILD